MSVNKIKTEICLNCETHLRPEDNYCPNCGQKNTTHIIPLKHILLETFEDFFHFDTKLWNTIKTTFAHPGKITRDYLEGKRARYVPPVKFYIFISFIFFLLLGKLSDHAIDERKNPQDWNLTISKSMSISLNELLGEKKLYYSKDSNDVRLIEFDFTSKDSLQRYLVQLKSAPDSVINKLLVEDDMDTTANVRKNFRNLLALIPEHSSALDSMKQNYFVDGKFEFETAEEYNQFKEKIRDYSDAQIDSVLISKGENANWVNRQLLRKFRKFDWKDKDDMKVLIHAVLKSISLTMFVMMPVTALLLLLIFYRKKYYYEHLIFSIHIHTIFFLILSLVLGIQIFISDSLGNMLWSWTFLICLIYLVLSLKYNYKQPWGKTIAKFLLMSMPYLIISLTLAVVAIVYGFLA
ncbi:hypothetical protein AQPE_3526 [Aquipluma nitroreducens]|uniref:Gll1812 protein n=1 Tax=Aquipluma nitroreducens TaxID=2010828 RepID=A0A5K7SCL0_9BACT|nr:DUF3667 domain-containing protein [Aquipluma nitroreducens]BBE19341.1 hypothetical protein AQPE_3526 [Aquipluma nitroreducens]